MPKDDALVLPLALAQQIADYLMQRPYREVAGLVAELAKLQPLPDKPEENSEQERA